MHMFCESKLMALGVPAISKVVYSQERRLSLASQRSPWGLFQEAEGLRDSSEPLARAAPWR